MLPGSSWVWCALSSRAQFGINRLVHQLTYANGVTPGFRVHAIHGESPWVQFGLGPEDLKKWPKHFTLNTGALSARSHPKLLLQQDLCGPFRPCEGERSQLVWRGGGDLELSGRLQQQHHSPAQPGGTPERPHKQPCPSCITFGAPLFLPQYRDPPFPGLRHRHQLRSHTISSWLSGQRA